jgi:hypothetical protein
LQRDELRAERLVVEAGVRAADAGLEVVDENAAGGGVAGAA